MHESWGSYALPAPWEHPVDTPPLGTFSASSLYQLETALSNLLHNISHNLGTPLINFKTKNIRHRTARVQPWYLYIYVGFLEQ
jgi:hypothetical protein